MIVFPTRFLSSTPKNPTRFTDRKQKKFIPHTVRASPSFINYNLILQLVPPTYFLLQIYYLYNLVLLLPSHTHEIIATKHRVSISSKNTLWAKFVFVNSPPLPRHVFVTFPSCFLHRHLQFKISLFQNV
jgi:hypothetical protein